MPWRFSRSHDQCYIDCPRKAFLTYYYKGTGIVPSGLDLYQETGSLTHAIIEQVMRYAHTNKTVPAVPKMNMFCEGAIAAYRQTVVNKGFDQFSGSIELEMQRQTALAEGLARIWTLNRLPQILHDYEILAVEQEHNIPIVDGIELMSRIDGVLKRKADGALFAGPEFKTTGWMSDDFVESWRYSTQTLSHCLDVKHIYGEFPSGVVMEFLYKGMKRKDKETGEYTYYSPLVRAFKMTDSIAGVDEYGFDSALGRKKGWIAFEPYTMGMDKWVSMLPEEEVLKMLFNSIIYRSPRELDEWTRQSALRQARIALTVNTLNNENPTEEAATDLMAAVFPARLDQFCYSNQYKKKCPYLDVCYHVIDDPIGSGFTARTPHHPNEFSDEE